jgi:signal transduction histidine kinase
VTPDEQGLARRLVAFFGPTEPRRELSQRAWAADVTIAVVATLAMVASAVNMDFRGGAVTAFPTPVGQVVLGPPPTPGVILFFIALTTAPLAFRRKYPATAFYVLMTAVLVAHNYITTVTFAAAILAAYSAVVYSRYRRLALLLVAIAAVVVTAAFPDTTPPLPGRYTALLVLITTAAVATMMRTWQRRAGDSAERLRRAQAEHEGQTRRAVEAERARIASELHDVVTHNVSVMVVQAGAARRVLDSSPGEAREALLAVEASGRTAMGELRHLLGLLAPAAETAGGDAAVLVPQPGAAQVGALVDRVRAAGLSVELTVTGARTLSPGVDLAAYRVVQEALTNVIKHAGAARAAVTLEYRPDDLLITVTDDGRPTWPPAPGSSGPGPSGPGGRGLIGLRERIAIYGGELDAGPRPGGGWRVRARIPLEASAQPGGDGEGGGFTRSVRSQFPAMPT